MTTTFIELEKGWIIRLHNQFGFRWFKTKVKEGRIIKAMEAKKIELAIINGDKTHCFKEFIEL